MEILLASTDSLYASYTLHWYCFFWSWAFLVICCGKFVPSKDLLLYMKFCGKKSKCEILIVDTCRSNGSCDNHMLNFFFIFPIEVIVKITCLIELVGLWNPDLNHLNFHCSIVWIKCISLTERAAFSLVTFHTLNFIYYNWPIWQQVTTSPGHTQAVFHTDRFWQWVCMDPVVLVIILEVYSFLSIWLKKWSIIYWDEICVNCVQLPNSMAVRDRSMKNQRYLMSNTLGHTLKKCKQETN